MRDGTTSIVHTSAFGRSSSQPYVCSDGGGSRLQRSRHISADVRNRPPNRYFFLCGQFQQHAIDMQSTCNRHAIDMQSTCNDISDRHESTCTIHHGHASCRYESRARCVTTAPKTERSWREWVMSAHPRNPLVESHDTFPPRPDFPHSRARLERIGARIRRRSSRLIALGSAVALQCILLLIALVPPGIWGGPWHAERPDSPS